jgi:hypothetical protein
MLKTRIALLVVALALPVCLLAQDQKLTPTAADDVAAQQATSLNIIASRALTDAGSNAREADLIVTDNPLGEDDDRPSGPTLFPADLSKLVATAQTLETTTLHNIYINQPPSAWGDPVRFLNDLNHSRFIHITDQYVGVEFNNRYPLGTSFLATVTPAAGFPPAPNNIITIGQIIALLHAAGSITGTGHDHVYNVFIPPGTDTCFAGNTSCFSPDHPSTFAFCAFHSFVRFSDIGQVVFTVEPETGVPGCASQQPSPNGIVADSVDSTMSHELFETITDPDLNAWRALSSLDLRGFEIGDVCQPVGNSQRQFLVPTFRVHGHPYAIQLEYSNRGHGCFSRPFDEDDD